MSSLILAAALAHGSPSSVSAGAGRQLYTENCAACHGADLRGGPNAPTLIGVGAAYVDFMVSTGRMPAAVPWMQVAHRGLQPYLSPVDEESLVAYVASVSPGPPIPLVVTNGDEARGHVLFQQNCEHCHGVNGTGGSIDDRAWAPSLSRATVMQVAEAIRVGPGEMPQFSERQIDQADLDDIATYLSSQRGAERFTGLPVVAGGTVPEGLYGWLAAGLLSFFAFGFSSLDRKRTGGSPDAS
jgi:ubiquinol-cytochrome c reductase cytochrome c subunit